METKKLTSNNFSPEVRARAVRMVQDHRGDYPSPWAAMASIAAKIGCTGETLRNWVRQAEPAIAAWLKQNGLRQTRGGSG